MTFNGKNKNIDPYNISVYRAHRSIFLFTERRALFLFIGEKENVSLTKSCIVVLKRSIIVLKRNYSYWKNGNCGGIDRGFRKTYCW
jgi:hypothetical protein